jgi:hypothetical protein
MQPSDSLPTFGLKLRFPSLPAYPFDGCFFFAGKREHPLPRPRWRLVTGSPYHRILPGECAGPPRLLDRPFRARHSHPPRQVHPPLAHTRGERFRLQGT